MKAVVKGGHVTINAKQVEEKKNEVVNNKPEEEVEYEIEIGK
jgi:hypothetical protein